MRRPDRSAPTLTRRALARQLAGGAAVIVASPALAAPAAMPVDPGWRDAALRGMALAGHRGDPVAARAAAEAGARLAETDPEGALLYRLYQALDVRPAAYHHPEARWPPAPPAALERLHTAIAQCQPVQFGYTDLAEQRTERRVLPLALVHPAQGVKLLAWCEKAEGYRQFFVRAMQGLQAGTGDFRPERLRLLQGLVAKEGA